MQVMVADLAPQASAACTECRMISCISFAVSIIMQEITARLDLFLVINIAILILPQGCQPATAPADANSNWRAGRPGDLTDQSLKSLVAKTLTLKASKPPPLPNSHPDRALATLEASCTPPSAASSPADLPLETLPPPPFGVSPPPHMHLETLPVPMPGMVEQQAGPLLPVGKPGGLQQQQRGRPESASEAPPAVWPARSPSPSTVMPVTTPLDGSHDGSRLVAHHCDSLPPDYYDMDGHMTDEVASDTEERAVAQLDAHGRWSKAQKFSGKHKHKHKRTLCRNSSASNPDGSSGRKAPLVSLIRGTIVGREAGADTPPVEVSKRSKGVVHRVTSTLSRKQISRRSASETSTAVSLAEGGGRQPERASSRLTSSSSGGPTGSSGGLTSSSSGGGGVGSSSLGPSSSSSSGHRGSGALSLSSIHTEDCEAGHGPSSSSCASGSLPNIGSPQGTHMRFSSPESEARCHSPSFASGPGGPQGGGIGPDGNWLAESSHLPSAPVVTKSIYSQYLSLLPLPPSDAHAEAMLPPPPLHATPGGFNGHTPTSPRRTLPRRTAQAVRKMDLDPASHPQGANSTPPPQPLAEAVTSATAVAQPPAGGFPSVHYLDTLPFQQLHAALSPTGSAAASSPTSSGSSAQEAPFTAPQLAAAATAAAMSPDAHRPPASDVQATRIRNAVPRLSGPAGLPGSERSRTDVGDSVCMQRFEFWARMAAYDAAVQACVQALLEGNPAASYFVRNNCEALRQALGLQGLLLSPQVSPVIKAAPHCSNVNKLWHLIVCATSGNDVVQHAMQSIAQGCMHATRSGCCDASAYCSSTACRL